MNLRTLTTATCLALLSASGSYAASVDIDFAFDDGTNFVTGTVFGLDDEILTVQNATSVSVDANLISGAFSTSNIFGTEFLLAAGRVTAGGLNRGER